MDSEVGSREALRWAVALCWADEMAGRDVWAILAVNEHGFIYDGPVIGRRFQSWDEGRLWDRFQGRANALLARKQLDSITSNVDDNISPNARCGGFSLVENPGRPGQSSGVGVERNASHGGLRFSENRTGFLRRLHERGDRFDDEEPEAT